MAEQVEHQQGKKAIFERLAAQPEHIPKLLRMLEPRAWMAAQASIELVQVKLKPQ
jgi:hypothetical protein